MSRRFRSDDTSFWPYGYGFGVDGNLTISTDTTQTVIDSACSGTSGTKSLTATNTSFAVGQFILIIQMVGTNVGEYEFNRIASYTAGTITTQFDLQNTYSTGGADKAQVLVMPQYRDVTIDSTKTFWCKHWDGTVGGILAYFAIGTTTINGKIGSTGAGYDGPPIHNTGEDGLQGEGSTGTPARTSSANGNGGGGGGKGSDPNHSGGGGGGGNGAAGSNGLYDGGAAGSGGAAVGNAGLTQLFMGGGGGQGASGTGHLGSAAGEGGDGGGIILIVSRVITVNASTGQVLSDGVKPGGGFADEGSGGGGAGGSVLLKCQSATLATTKITAPGAAAGDASIGTGGAGAVGRIHIDYYSSFSGTTTPTIDSRKDPNMYGQLTSIIPFL